MAIDNYIDKITKDGESRMISPAADKVRVENEHYEGDNLDDVLDEIDEKVSQAGTGDYTKPSTGIPKSDMESAVQASLGKADSAVQGIQINGGSILPKVNNNVDIFVPTKNSQLQNDSGFITAEDVPSGVQFDTQMSSSSENGVQNKVIKAYVDNLIAGLIDGAPAALDTLKELATALGNNSDAYATLINLISSKANDNAVVKSISVNGTAQTKDSSGNVNIQVQGGAQGPKGDTGNVNITDADELVTILVNDLVTGGAGNILSAEMGRRLAMMSGTYAQAWARSKAIPFPFCFLWVETVDGDAISKPIWHKGNSVFVDAAGSIVNVDAAAVPNAPTITGATGGTEVPKNTQITITPAAGSALYYSLDGGTSYNVSDATVTIALTTAGSVSIVAYCANNAGNSSNATLNITVAGTPVPVFSPASGEVARGGYVTISVPNDGELHYKVGSGSWQTASGTSASVQITGTTTIQAYNVQDGDTSTTVSATFTMAALAAPTFSPASGTELPIGGGTVELSAASGATIYYTTDGSTPTTNSTQYTSAIQVTEGVTIRAIANDTYGSSEVATATYTIKEDAIIIDTTDATASVTLGYKDTSNVSQTVTIALDSAVDSPAGSGKRNTIAINSTNFPNLNTSKQFSSISFSDKTKVKRIYGGGAIIPAGPETYCDASALVYFEANIGSGNTNMYRAFYNTPAGAVFKVSGTADSFQDTFRCSSINSGQTVDLTGLEPYSNSGFSNCNGLVVNQQNSTLKINGSFKISQNATKQTVVSSVTTRVIVKYLEIHSDTPPDLTVDWFAGLVAQALANSTTISLKVPAGKIDTYKAAAGWSTYADNANVSWGEIS